MEPEIPFELLSEDYRNIAKDVREQSYTKTPPSSLPMKIDVDLEHFNVCTFSPTSVEKKISVRQLKTTSTAPKSSLGVDALTSPKSVKKLMGKAISMEEYLKHLSGKYHDIRNKKRKMEHEMSVQGEAYAETSNKLSIAGEEIQEIKANLLLKERELQSLRKEREEFVMYRNRQSKYCKKGVPSSCGSHGGGDYTSRSADQYLVVNLQTEIDEKTKEFKKQVKENQYQSRELKKKERELAKCKKQLEDLEFKKDDQVNKLEFKLAETNRQRKEIDEELRTCQQLMRYKTKCILELNRELEKTMETETQLLQSRKENTRLKKEMKRMKKKMDALTPVLNLNQSVISESEDSGRLRKENEMLENENMFLKRSLESKRKRLSTYIRTMETQKKKLQAAERKVKIMKQCAQEMGLKEVFLRNLKKVKGSGKKSRGNMK